MTTLGTYQKIVIAGTAPGSEIWQTGFNTVCTTPPTDQPSLQTYLDNIAPFITTWWTALKPFIFTTYKLQKVSAYQYTDPSTTASLQALHVFTPVAGTQGGVGSPIDTCAVVSIRSAHPGRSGRNRMYVPLHDPCDSTGMFSSSGSSTAAGTATKAMFTSIVSSTIGAPAVVSRHLHQWFPPSAIDTDNKPDVQRRRENRLVPTSTQVLAFP